MGHGLRGRTGEWPRDRIGRERTSSPFGFARPGLGRKLLVDSKVAFLRSPFRNRARNPIDPSYTSAYTLVNAGFGDMTELSAREEA